MARLLGTVAAGALAGAAAFVALMKWDDGDAVLHERIAGLEAEVAQRDVQLEYLRERERVARIDVVEQVEAPAAPGGMRTTVRFQELGADGGPLGPALECTLDGDVVYVDARVIKFDDAFVERNDLLRGSTLLVFQRLFGEYQAPADGFRLDASGQLPAAYSAEQGVQPFHESLWKDFWKHALDPAMAREGGVRAMHGEAPYIKLAPGRSYEVELRTSEGLTLRALEPAS